jgi:hypothetical protein
MKALILLIASVLFFTVVNAQTNKDTIKKVVKQESLLKKEVHAIVKGLKKLETTEINSQTKQQFIQDFGNIPDVKWENSTYYGEATFKKDGKVFTAYYDYNAGLVGTVSERSFSELPIKAKEFLNEKYHDYKICDVVFFDDDDLNETDMFIYNIQVDDEDSYFVELKKDNKKIVVQVLMDGSVYFLTRIN